MKRKIIKKLYSVSLVFEKREAEKMNNDLVTCIVSAVSKQEALGHAIMEATKKDNRGSLSTCAVLEVLKYSPRP